MLPRRELLPRDLAQPAKQRGRKRDQPRARARVDSGIYSHDSGTWLVLDRDEEPSAPDVERQRAYADWLASLEPRKDRSRHREEVARRRAHHVDTGSGKGAA